MKLLDFAGSKHAAGKIGATVLQRNHAGLTLRLHAGPAHKRSPRQTDTHAVFSRLVNHYLQLPLQVMNAWIDLAISTPITPQQDGHLLACGFIHHARQNATRGRRGYPAAEFSLRPTNFRTAPRVAFEVNWPGIQINFGSGLLVNQFLETRTAQPLPLSRRHPPKRWHDPLFHDHTVPTPIDVYPITGTPPPHCKLWIYTRILDTTHRAYPPLIVSIDSPS